jgi:hypothetical protein
MNNWRGSGFRARWCRFCQSIYRLIVRSEHVLLADAKAGEHGIEDILDTDVTGDAAERAHRQP